MIEMNIPQTLRAEPSWVCVRNDSKVPLNPATRRFASPSDENTWNDFETCLNAVYSGKYDGIGYAFHDNGIIGIDIDTGFDEDGFLSDTAIDIIEHCQSYTELSRSGRGMHILVKGSLPIKGANNRNGVEIYKTGRYFIMTGKKLLYADIKENQSAIDYILDKYFPAETKESVTGCNRVTFYKAENKVVNGKVVKFYPPIPDGCRNLSLTSLAGQLHSSGADGESIKATLIKVNESACTPPLPESEIDRIIKSIMRYRNV